MNADFVEALFSMIGRGLIWYHFDELLEDSCHVEARALTTFGEEKIKRQFFSSLDKCVYDDIGNGGFQYVGQSAAENPKITMWLMRFYSGVKFEEMTGDQESQCMLVTSGPKRVYEKAKLAAAFGVRA